ncbi:Peroxiredoxin [Komagataella phaffii CBS 7435]|uniref:Thiol-specific peroxiredoxin, reduces hydroperoxides to protect against oxidative damage n=2 Tax=Komagataella phaffii TaxID=460519 RepID=C4R0V9_KOMPG|nr:Thiol-specific peroxiredoxin, reduces hydroperoxides to protect against oxidative damage [Komagataella phaffii GS115]AOA62855.1 GQ67_00548T0 [Komagataella phaffii]CAH2448345.1 Peroxiredoxin [Komagataella phaffii CBS 7435]AOA67528.1 GQ68_00840T0 [Komagataella phaffii GS115]CAY69133.1 Thiol-specific peroxiredoxin, reduces hydroperoxides to protect against oxidative damage [Komagataella phaffii GS115]SCV12062.1 Peroxiredoxin [Komagataella phaffii CBS 7435]
MLRRYFSSNSARMVQVGQSLPKTTLFVKDPSDQFESGSIEPNSVIVTVPAAFSPTCSDTHVPGYLTRLKDLKSKNINHLYVVSVNDPFVTNAWKKTLLKSFSIDKTEVPVTFLADPKGDFIHGLDLDFDSAAVFGNNRSKRSALIIGSDGKVAKDFVEPDNTGLKVSAVDSVLKAL